MDTNIISFQSFLLDESFTRLMNILRGDVPNVNTMAIITGHNPMGDEAPAKKNNAANKKLQNDIRNAHFYSFPVTQPIMGDYGIIEKGFLIPHIDRVYAIKLAARYRQEAIIFGTKQKDEHGQDYIDFEWIATKGDTDPESYHTTAHRKIVISGSEAQERGEMFSATPFPRQKEGESDDAYKGRMKNVNRRKFWIPFYSDKHADAQYSLGKRSIDYPPRPQVPTALSPTGTDESVDPGVEIDKDVSFILAELPDTLKVRQLIDEIKRHHKVLMNENKTEKSKWIHRAEMRDAMRELSAINARH